MYITLLPIPLLRGSAIIIFAVGIFMVAAHTILATLATQRSALNPRMRVMAPLFIGAFLAVWLSSDRDRRRLEFPAFANRQTAHHSRCRFWPAARRDGVASLVEDDAWAQQRNA